MLEDDYSNRFGELIRSVDWDIELPVEWTDFFAERGEMPSFGDDERHNQRLKVRTHGVMFFDRSLPFLSRPEHSTGVYTRDFSSHGCGILSPFELFPEEDVRLIVPTFWLQLHVVRTRRITSKCYEVGCALRRRYDPGPEAFVMAESAVS